ncbi:MAG TPA: hypothetical protein VEH77_04140 [Roseiarcus sp.]|nr:hypothetical protein [Roseiarcus sp.]
MVEPVDWVGDLKRLREYRRRIVSECERNVTLQRELVAEVEALGGDASQFKALHWRHELRLISLLDAAP